MKTIKLLNKILLLLIIIMGIFLVGGISYSYFTSGIKNAETDTTIRVVSGNISVLYSSGSSIEIINSEPSTNPFATKTFTITASNTFTNKVIWYQVT